MNWRTALQLALALTLLGLLGPALLSALELAEEDRFDSAAGWCLRGAGGVLGLAIVLWILEKIGLKVAGARCVDCKRRISYGHLYCHDHLRERTWKAQAKHHDERGMGV